MFKRLVVILLFCALVACGGSPRAPVEDRNRRAAPPYPVYLVQRGDTLYSIAFRYGLDYRKVAAANRIAPPYTIYPGQKLFLKEAPVPPPARGAGSEATASSSPPAAKAEPSPKSAPVTRRSPPPAIKTAPAGPAQGPVTAWRWPTSGRVTRGFSPSVHKGIDIDGSRGDAIHAVADGTVVYAGTGIVGMGDLLIVKHNDIYLSAYAHNDRLLVAEGERVRTGQKIATKGSSGTDSVKLHFEIRREGKPVDPRKLLPRR